MEATYRVLKYLKDCPGKVSSISNITITEKLLQHTLMLIGLVHQLKGCLLLIIAPLFGIILSHGIARNSQWWLGQVQKLNLSLCKMEYVNYYG